MRKHVSKKAQLIPPDHINPGLSGGLGEVVETMMAKDREGRYRGPEDLIVDLECLLRGERPRMAEQKMDALAMLSQGEAAEEEESRPKWPRPRGRGRPPGTPPVPVPSS